MRDGLERSQEAGRTQLTVMKMKTSRNPVINFWLGPVLWRCLCLRGPPFFPSQLSLTFMPVAGTRCVRWRVLGVLWRKKRSERERAGFHFSSSTRKGSYYCRSPHLPAVWGRGKGGGGGKCKKRGCFITFQKFKLRVGLPWRKFTKLQSRRILTASHWKTFLCMDFTRDRGERKKRRRPLTRVMTGLQWLRRARTRSCSRFSLTH